VFEELQGIIDPYQMGVAIVDLNFTNARPPNEVRAAFDDAIAAQEDEERFIREAEAYAREIEPRARASVNRLNEEAQAYKERAILESQGEVARFEELLPQYEAAPVVTRQRLYLETLESVYSNVTKIMIDTEGGGNMMFLPLDKIMERQGQAPATGTMGTLEGLRNQGADSDNQLPDPMLNTGRINNRSGRD
jgi:membrane protease subunit HflK